MPRKPLDRARAGHSSALRNARQEVPHPTRKVCPIDGGAGVERRMTAAVVYASQTKASSATDLSGRCNIENRTDLEANTMTDDNKGPTAWRAAFGSLIELAHQPAWRTTPPRFVVKQGRLSPWWSPVLWLARRPSAWSAWRNVVVSSDLLDQPPNRYLLAHELGHLAHRHHARYLATTVWVVGLGILLATLGPTWPVAARATGLILFLCGVGHMIGLCSLRSEYEADRFAAQLIGTSATVEGVAQHARKVDGVLQRSAQLRIEALAKRRPKAAPVG